MATQTWCDICLQAALTNLIANILDYSSILLQLTNMVRITVKKQLRLKNAWLEEEDIKMVELNN